MHPGNDGMMTASGGLGNMIAPPPEGTQQQYCLRWNSYPATIATQLATLRLAEDFVDVTLACDDQQLRAHKLVLSACSPYFMQLFKSTPCQHPVVFLKDVRFSQLRALLEFMYAGEVNVSQTELPALLRTAEALQIRGLADTTNNNSFAPQFSQKQQPIFSQHQQYLPIPNPVVTSPPQPIIPSVTTPQVSALSQQTHNSPLQMMESIDTVDSSHMLSMSSELIPPSITTRSVELSKGVSSMENESSKENRMDSSSDSNDSNDNYNPESLSQYGKPIVANEAQFFAPLTDNPFETVSNTGDGEVEEIRDGQESGFEGLGSMSLGGSQSEVETSEDENDEDDGEIKEEFPFPSDVPYSNQELGEGNTNTNGGNLADSSMMSSFSFSPNSDKPKDLNPMNSLERLPPPPRNRFSRSFWPPHLPYHGPQQCPYCPRVLSNVGNWRKHVVTMHIAREKNQKCVHCNSCFRTPEYLQKHYVRVHSYQPKMSRKKSHTVTGTPITTVVTTTTSSIVTSSNNSSR